MPRPIVANISIAALRANLAQVRQRVGHHFVWAVVKADGYGHGTLTAARGFADADGLALIDFDEASRLRGAGWTKPLLMLEGAFDRADLKLAQALALTLVVHDEAGLTLVKSLPAGSRLPIYLKLNTGMNRLGFSGDEQQVRRLLTTLAQHSAVEVQALMTHLASADVEHGAERQLRVFQSFHEGTAVAQSVANSAAIFSDLVAPTGNAFSRSAGRTLAPALRQEPGLQTDSVRPGIALYGSSPFAAVDGPKSARGLGLTAAMALRSKLIGVQTLAPGDSVGYGAGYTATRPMRIGIVACGYADGYPRHAPTGTPIAVGGRRTQTVGRVSMDMLAVDLEPLPMAGVGTPVEMWGPLVGVDEVAMAAGTIGYELLVKRLPRVRLEVMEHFPEMGIS
jgi:alanine racemase